MRAKYLFLSVFFVVINSALNITMFLLSYKKLVFPFIDESQRVNNAPYIIFYVFPSFFIVSILMLITIYAIYKKCITKPSI